MPALQGLKGLYADPQDLTDYMDEGVLEARANPVVAEHGEYGSQAPMATTPKVVRVMWTEARLPKKGSFLVLMIWTIRVWVRSDSTNQPV